MMKIKVLLVAALAFLISNAAFTENLAMDYV
ncbi:TPA: cytochrome c1, partial [Legionella pneumophila subsp. pneumophila]|nr:cytochrome c1 [Legionella pneumophila subsp. pneumophila]